MNPPSVPFNPVCADLLARLDRVPGFSLFVNERAALLLVPSELVGVIAGNAAADAMIRAGLSAATIARLDLLASGLAPMSGVRLERLELPSAGGPVVLTAACRRIRDDDGRMVLVPTDFSSSQLAREVETFIDRFKSIPAFTANLTMEYFQKQTQC